MRFLLILFFAVSCSFWDSNREVELRFVPGCAAWREAPPSGTLTVGTTAGLTRVNAVFRQPLIISISTNSSGWAVWQGPAGEPLGAVWTRLPVTLLLDAHGGFLASVLERCAGKGVPVGEWNLDAVSEAFRKTAAQRPPVYWDPDRLTEDLLAGRQGPGLFRLLERRNVELVLPEGDWVPEWTGLPIGSGEWPLGLWSFADSGNRIWVQVGPTGPVLLRKSARPDGG